jgi:hypothetical protein
LHLLQKDNLYVDYTAPDFEQKKQAIIQELSLIFDKQLTEEGKKAFLQAPVAEDGAVVFGATDELNTYLSTLFPAGIKTIDVTEETTFGNPEIDALLKKYDVYKLNKLFDTAYVLSYRVAQNPFIVSKEFAELTKAFRYAEPNAYFSIAGFGISRMGSHGIYMFHLGWGDCPAGCIEENRTIFEVHVRAGTVTKVGQTGDPVDPEFYGQYFIQVD